MAMRKELNLLEEIKNQLIDFELQTGWYNKLVDETSTNLNEVVPTSQIRREYNVERSTYLIIIDILRQSVDFYSQSFLKSNNMKIEYSYAFESNSKQLYNILIDHVQDNKSNKPMFEMASSSIENLVRVYLSRYRTRACRRQTTTSSMSYTLASARSTGGQRMRYTALPARR